jgi:hypothetical protein
MGLEQKEGGLPSGVTGEDILHYIYAVFHSTEYRTRYADFLKGDFPRIPMTKQRGLFNALVHLGAELTASHLLAVSRPREPITVIGRRNPTVEKVSWLDNTVYVDKAKTTGFRGVRENVWNFYIGGYQVCDKWLKDRKGQVLSAADIRHYQQVCASIGETVRLMGEIEKSIARAGGWAAAFDGLQPQQVTNGRSLGELMVAEPPAGEYKVDHA